MYSYLEIENEIFEDVSVKFCGMQECLPKYSYGPAIRNHYIIHYCLKGKGTYHVKDKIYPIEAGQAFIIYPNETTFYQADEKDPWVYQWIGFSGKKADLYIEQCGFFANHHVVTCANKLIESCVVTMIEHHQMSYSNELFIQGQLYLFFSYLSQTSSQNYRKDLIKSNNIYITKAIEFIQNNYQNTICVQDLAKYLSLNRTYLSALFQKHLQISPQQFLHNYRLTKARDLLVDTHLPISQVAYSCGYSNPLAFSKAFRQLYLSSPTDYRKLNTPKDGHISIK